ncbi:hypothetical protein G6F65_021158 [Rhizopus arrhizus]|nr:hypothetical protein G6F65_021158 [Rhizopus arrhizus]
MRAAAGAGRAERELARVLFGVGDQFAHRVHGQGRVHHQHDGKHRRHADRHEVAADVVAEVPSGSALAANCAPTIPPAPDLLSTTVGTDHNCPSGCVVKRAVVSTGPPAGKGTMKVTACPGHVAARAVAGNKVGTMVAAHAAPSPATTRRR